MMPEDWKAKIGKHDAIYFGAVGWPAKIPDHVSLWGSLIKFRREFDQYVNLRPVRLMPGVPSPLANRKRAISISGCVRENTEGEYSSVGGRMFPDTDREFVTQQTVMTRIGVDRILKFAFELAQSRPKKHLTSATKSNGISITMPYWDERVEAMARNYPAVKWDKYHIDILTANFVLHPDWFDVVVGSNLFGDILSDLGPAAPAPSASHRQATSIRKGISPRCSSRCTAPRPISRAGHRQSDRHDLVRRHDAGAPRREDRRGVDCGCDRAQRSANARCAPGSRGNADTTACGKAVAEMVE